MTENNNKGLQNSEIFVIVIFVIIIIAAFFLNLFNKNRIVISNINDNSDKFVETIVNSPLFARVNELASKKLDEIQNANVNNSGVAAVDLKKEIFLVNKISNEIEGLLFYSRQNGENNINIETSLPDVLDGYYYSAWLTGANDFQLKIGQLRKNANSTFDLKFSTTNDLAAANKIIVALESSAEDLNKIKEILIGNF